MTPDSVAQAAKLIRTGEISSWARALGDMPLFTARSFDLHTKRTNGPLGTNKRYRTKKS